MSTTQTLPATITARIHPNAINRVNRFFNATVGETLNELLQNARRAQATRVDVTVENGRVTVSDDGQGIADPSALLAFGQSDWNPETARSEDPAGMGVYSLSRHHATIRSRCADQPAWQVKLAPEHFDGSLPAPVEILADEGIPRGATVTFDVDHEEAVFQAVQRAARYYPLPVACNGELLERKDFLDQALRVEEWQGVHIGAYRGYVYHLRPLNARLNFHGLLVQHTGLPTVSAIEQTWTAMVDVIDCPRLELTLPARREVVRNSFLHELQEACRQVIYRTMLEQEPVAVPFAVRQDAARLGIQLPEPPPRLKPWVPEFANSLRTPNTIPVQPVPEDAIVMPEGILETCDAQTFYRAARRQGLHERLFLEDSRYQGFQWYDEMDRAGEIAVSITDEDQTRDLETLRALPYRDRPAFRPQAITFELATRNGPDPARTRRIVVPGDVVFVNHEADAYDDPQVLLCEDASCTVGELVGLMVNSFFQPSEDIEADSVATQEEDCEQNFQAIAVTLLRSEEEAIITAVRQAVQSHVLHHIPPGKAVAIRIVPGQAPEVALSP